MTNLDIRVTIKKNNWGEYVCRLHYNGKHQAKLDYFTDHFDDARDTAEAMRENFEKFLINAYLGNAKVNTKMYENEN